MHLEKPVIITTEHNICGRNIRQALISQYPFQETEEKFDKTPIFEFNNIRLVKSDKDVIFSDHCDSLEADLLLFGSRHQSQANKPSLLTHATGNLSEDNSHGGNPLELSFTSAQAIREAYLGLKEQRDLFGLTNFDVTVEATHHGPTSMKTPLLYVEVGSTEIEYQNEFAILAVANTIMQICTQKEAKKIAPSICFGGGHYATRFNELMELTSVAVSHILPKYHREHLTPSIVEQMIEKTKENVQWAIIDRSSLNATHIQIIKDVCSTKGIEVVKARDIKYGKIV
ncbi:MAG: D-aminoacyl-tRNA deacylase [Candidatus Heimdallarchaeota archaeon]